jgi:hypothetical protein
MDAQLAAHAEGHNDSLGLASDTDPVPLHEPAAQARETRGRIKVDIL